MRQTISFDQFVQEVSQQLPFPIVVSISPFAMTQDTMLQFSSIYSQAVAVAAQQAAIRLFKGVLIIGLTRAADLIIGLKPVEPLALIEEARARVKNHG